MFVSVCELCLERSLGTMQRGICLTDHMAYSGGGFCAIIFVSVCFPSKCHSFVMFADSCHCRLTNGWRLVLLLFALLREK